MSKHEGRPAGIMMLVLWLFVEGSLSLIGLLGVLVMMIGPGHQGGIPFSIFLGVVLTILLTFLPAAALMRRRSWGWFVAGIHFFGGLFLLPVALYLSFAPFMASTLAEPKFVEAKSFIWVALVLTSLILGAVYLYLFRTSVRAHFGLDATNWIKPVLGHLAIYLVLTAPLFWILDSDFRQSTDHNSLVQLEKHAGLVETNPDSERFVLNRLVHGDAEERNYAAWALKSSQTQESIDQLGRTCNQDTELSVRANAATSLGIIGGEAVFAPLVGCLDDEAPEVRAAVLGGLAHEEFAAAAERVAQMLTDEAGSVRLLAVELLGLYQDPSVVPNLHVMADDEDGDVRRSVAFLLGKLKSGDAVPTLVILLEDERWDVRANAAVSLGLIGDAAARRPLTRSLDDPNAQVRMAAEEALSRLPIGEP